MAKEQKEIDVIDLDSDSDNETTVQNPSVSTEVLKQPDRKLVPNTENDITCIDLESVESSTSTLNKNVLQEISKVTPESSGKKIDFFNLEDSDTDIECENVNNDANSLIESASVLNDVPVGPQKPIEVTECYKNVPDSVLPTKELDKIPLSCLNIDGTISNLQGNTTDLSQRRTSCDSENSVFESVYKHFKGDHGIGINNVTDDSELESNMPPLYREDCRVISETENILCRIPRQITQTHNAHSNIITSLEWCRKFSYLYLSSSLDGTLKIWDLFYKNVVKSLKFNSGLGAAKWSLDGGQIVTGGKGKQACVYDVESGTQIALYDIYNIITSLEVHPYMEDVFLCGTRNAILGFDMRVNTTMPIRAFFSKCEEVLDLAFVDESQFICSTNIVSEDSADRTIMVWHFGSGAKLSNQVYLERFTCPSIKVHPHDSSFIAQSNGNYIASFSASAPYKIKNKRYIGHKVAGYGIECDISPDGKYVVSGDAEGSVYFYNYSNTNTVFITPAERKIPINKVKWHPAQSSTLITSSYDGQINVWK